LPWRRSAQWRGRDETSEQLTVPQETAVSRTRGTRHENEQLTRSTPARAIAAQNEETAVQERKRKIQNTNVIKLYVHCALCMDELPAGLSPREWAQLEVGFTKRGIQVWCKRHELNVMHMDFEGQKHKVNTTAVAR
jgi:hypothetical protein